MLERAVHYRVYKLNPAGRIVSGDWIEAQSDSEAIRLAQGLCDAATPSVELWEAARRVATLQCDTAAA